MKSLSDIEISLDKIITVISEFDVRELLALNVVLERAYVHTMVEIALRDAELKGVSSSLSVVDSQ